MDEETGDEIPISPCTILNPQVARAADAGYAIKAGSEFEFYVLKNSWEDAYLRDAAMIGAGLYGIEHGLMLEPEFRGQRLSRQGHPRIPRALYEAISELERSEAAVEIFEQDVVDHYMNAPQVEQDTYDSMVHPWDRERYLERG